MTHHEFLAELKRSVHDLPASAVKRAGIDYLASLGGRAPTRADLESAVTTLRGSGPTGTVAVSGSVVMEEPIAAFLPRDLIESATLADRFEGHVRTLRKKHLGKEGRPFTSPSAARRWIATTAEAEQKDLPDAGGRMSAARKESAKLGEISAREQIRISRSTGLELTCRTNLSAVYLSYPAGSKSDPGTVFAPFGGKLYNLAKGVQRIADWTGFQVPTVSWWVLLDVRPILPRITWTAHRLGPRNWVEVKFNAMDLAWNELREVYRRLRSASNVRRQRVNQLHFRIWQIVRARGGVPQKGKGELWRSVRKELLTVKGLKVPGTWHGIRKAYCELVEEASAEKKQKGPRG